MLQRYSVRLRIYSWFLKYLPPPWRLRASSLPLSGDDGRRQQALTLIFWPGTASLDFIHMLIKDSVKRRAETCRTQAGRPTNFSFKPNQPSTVIREDQERPRECQRQTEKIPDRRPRRGWPTPLCIISSLVLAWKLSRTTTTAYN
jgi:hypothetical protein